MTVARKSDAPQQGDEAAPYSPERLHEMDRAFQERMMRALVQERGDTTPKRKGVLD